MRMLAVLALTLQATACRQASYPLSMPHPLLGQPLPAIQRCTTLDGRPFDTTELAGRPAVVKFFADYCKPCKESLPRAEGIHETYPDVVFLGIDEDDSVETASAVARRFSLTFPVIHDDGNVLSGRFRVSTMPTTFVADPWGVIRWVGGEGQTEDELRRAVEAAR